MKYIGVAWKPRAGNFEAYIKPLGTWPQLSLGRFLDPRSAAQVYDAAAILLHQNQAQRNFPDETPSEELLRHVAHRIVTRKQCPPHVRAMLQKHLTQPT